MPAVVVVGSGAAGLAAALAAADAGASVVVLEASGAVGGTTALSGGVVWAPGNHLGPQADRAADRAAALQYLGALARGDVSPELLQVFVDQAGRVVRALEERTPLQWELLGHWPDYRQDVQGASAGGRSLWPRPLQLPAAVADRVQRDPTAAIEQPAGPGAPGNDGAVLRGPTRGRVLVGALLAAMLDRGIEIRTGVPAARLVLEDGAVAGVEAGGERLSGRVVLATGGFQFDPTARRAFLPGAPVAPMGVPTSTGDGLRMAQRAGAALGNMAEGWWMPAMQVPGEELGGLPFFRPLHAERAKPGAVLVDRSGRRFVNEAQNYGDVGRAMARAHTGAAVFAAAPCWLVLGAGYRHRYPIGPLGPSDPDPPWMCRGADRAELADAIGVPADVLDDTLSRFDAAAARREDRCFGRGGQPYDRWIGDPAAAHPTLGPVGEGPLYALAVHLGCMGTRGGPRTDAGGRVLGLDGRPLPGLYAAGNAAASPFGTATAAGGATLGPALTYGFLAGEAAAGDR